MPISFSSQSSRHKRPRSHSSLISPSSSPKRAASESDDPIDLGSELIRHNMDLTDTIGRASSPLRDVTGANEGEWIQKTEKVHLNEVEDAGTEKYKQLYDDFLGAIPPPFMQFHTYYVIPRSFKTDLEALALSDSAAKSASPSDLMLDLTNLVESVEGEEVVVIDTKADAEGSRTLSVTGKKERYWTLKDGLSEDEDFLFIHGDGWVKIMECLGDYDGPRLPRFCLPGETIQMKPPIFTLYIVEPAHKDQSSTEAISSTKPIRFTCPTKTSARTFLGLARRLASGAMGPNYDTPIMRCWQLDLANPPSDSASLPALASLILSHTLLPSLAGQQISDAKDQQQATIEELGMTNGDGIVVEIGKIGPFEKEIWAVDVNKDGKAIEKGAAVMPPVPTAPPPLFSKPAMFGGVEQSASNGGDRMATRSQSRQGDRRGKGLVGLSNLGNTCFMNSAVQCLSNTRELSEYFLSGVYTDELNVDNPLGMHGQIAKAFGTTVEALWSSAGQSYSPKLLKGQTGRFAPQFAGYGQHDTQEFIAFLLDGLHEDLNRIIKKPYIEKPDWKAGGGDRQLAELGKECWDGYKKRNDSVIVDLFQGQLQSTLVCPECNKESITLDPFMYLTVPLPIAQHRLFKLTFVPRDPSQKAVKVRLLIGQNASFQKIKERLGSLLKVNPSNLVAFDLWHGQVYSWFYDSDHNLECKDHDEAVFYDVGVPVTTSKRTVGTTATDGSITVPVFTYKVVDSKHMPTECALPPFFITLSKSEATDTTAVREAIMKGYQRYVSESVKANLFVSSTSSHAAVPSSSDQDEEVTDIHVDDPSSSPAQPSSQTMDVDQSPSQSVPHLSPKILQRKAGSSTSLSSLSSMRSHKTAKLVPRGDLFKVNVADASAGQEKGLGNMFKSKDNTVQPLFKGSLSEATRVFSPLENRLKLKKGMFNRFASGINHMMNSGTSAADSEGDNDSAPPTPNSPQPVVRPGEGIFVEWSVRKFGEYFDSAEQPETFEDPAIEIEGRKKKEGRVIGIEDCLDEFSKEETLGQDDLWYCPVCKKHQAATKKLEIYKAPDILVICIKRFGSSRRLADKLDNLVNFPVEGLDLEERVGERRIAKTLDLSDEECRKYDIEPSSEPLVYDLYAVDNHFGGLGGGHYTAFCKNKFDDEWYNYDDSRVSPSSEKSIQSRAAYLLFYRRRAIRPIGGKSREKAEQASRAVSPEPASSGSESGTSSGASPIKSNRLVLRQDEPELDTESSPPPYASSSTAATSSSPFESSQSSEAGVDADIQVDTRADSDSDERRSVDLRTVGQGLGFGNTAWSARAEVETDKASTTDTAELDDRVDSSSGSNTSDTQDLEAEEGSETKEALGEGYQLIDKAE